MVRDTSSASFWSFYDSAKWFDRLPYFYTYAYSDAPLAEATGMLPVVIFSPGATVDRRQDAEKLEGLASRGYVVAWGWNVNGQITVPVALLGNVPLLPSLKALPNGNELIISWPTNAVGFTLQSTLNLIPPVTWTDSTQSPVVLGAQFTVTNTPASSIRVYRLRKP